MVLARARVRTWERGWQDLARSGCMYEEALTRVPCQLGQIGTGNVVHLRDTIRNPGQVALMLASICEPVNSARPRGLLHPSCDRRRKEFPSCYKQAATSSGLMMLKISGVVVRTVIHSRGSIVRCSMVSARGFSSAAEKARRGLRVSDNYDSRKNCADQSIENRFASVT